MQAVMPSLNLSICVVLFESVAVTQRFHRELLASLAGFSDWEVLLYDNSPGHALATHFNTETPAQPQQRYWHDPRNLGFSFANNQLILRARHERVLLLNPDVFGLDAAFWSRIAALQLDNEARFIRLLNADGSFQDCVGEPASLARAFKPRPDYAALRQPTVVGMGIMAFMLTDKQVLAKVGLLDTGYPLYAEDMDWCWRATQAGCRVVYDPTLQLTHLGGASAADRWSQAASRKRKYLAERIFIGKHLRGVNGLAMQLLNRLKVLLKARA
jgi:GT2 family glycosyltransferase